MSKIVAVGNLKGGTGKSTVAVNLACALAGKRTRVVLVDADDQGTATEWASGGGLPVSVEPLPLTGGDRKTWIDRVMDLAEGTTDQPAADWVVIDLPPHIGEAMVAAFASADVVLVPVTPSGADLRATSKALEFLARAREGRSDGGPSCFLVPSKVDRRTAVGREIEAVLHEYGERVAPAITQRSAHVDAFSARQWVGAYQPRSTAHDEIETLAALVRRAK
jgi:chromosome partitioning protein